MQVKVVQHGYGERGAVDHNTGELVCGPETLSDAELEANRVDFGRRSLTRFAQKVTLAVRHRGARPLIQCSAVEEFVDGSEMSATEDLAWNYEGDDVLLSLTRYSLRP